MADVKRLQIRRDTAANWASVNPMLLEGEIGLILGGKSLKIGDGVNSWSQLPTLSLLEDADREKLSEIILFYEGTDTDDTINKWKELEAFLAGQTETSTLAELLSVKADRTELEQVVSDMGQMDARLSGLIGTKQDAISDLGTIRSNAANGNTAYGWGDHSKAGYAMASSLTATQEEVRVQGLTIDELRESIAGKAGQSSVEQIVASIEELDEFVGNLTTDDVDEGSRKYFTEDLARAAVSEMLTALDTRISQNESNIQDHENKITANTTNLNTTIQRVAANEASIERIDGYCDVFNADIGDLKVTVKGHSTSIEALQTSSAEHSSLLQSLQNGLTTTNATVAKHSEDITALAEAVEELSESWITSTDDLDEGSTNLYFTNARAKEALASELANKLDKKLSSGMKVVATDASGNIVAHYVTTTQLGYLANVTSDLQAQIDAISAPDLSGYLTSDSTLSSAKLDKNSITIAETPVSLGGSISTNTLASKLGLSNFLTGITSSMVTTALGYTPYNAANFTKANIKSTLGISDWALAASKPTYTAAEVGALSSSGGKMTGPIDYDDYTSLGAHSNGNFYLGNPTRPLIIRSNGTHTINGNTLIHSGNISSYAVTSSNLESTLSDYPLANGTRATGTWGIDISGSASKLDSNTLMSQIYDWNSGFSSSIFRSSENKVTNSPNGNFTYGIHLRFHRGTAIYYTDLVTDLYNDVLSYRRHTENGFGSWKTIAFTDSTVAAANKLSTARTIWGHSFDGSGDVSGALTGVSGITFTSNGTMYSSYGNPRMGATAADWTVYSKDSVALFQVVPSGSVLIGMTTQEGYKLSVNGSVQIKAGDYIANRATLILNSNNEPADIIFKNNSTKSGNYGYWAVSSRSGEDSRFSIYRGSENAANSIEYEAFTIAPSSNVGIGTTNPNTKLHVVGGAKIEGGLTVGSTTDYIAYDGSSLTGYKSSAAAWSIDPSGNGSFASLTVGGNAVLTQGALTSINSTLNNKANTSDVIPWSATHNYTTTVNPNVPTSPVSDRWYLVVKAAENGNQLMVNVPWVNTTYDLSSYLPKAGGTISGSLTFSATSGNHIIGNANNVLQLQPGTGSAPVLPIKIAKLSSGRHTIYCDEDQAYDLGTSSYSYYYVYSRYSSASSDATKKNIIGNIPLTTAQIANAPAVSFTWKDSGEKSHGTIAQYWKEILPEFVSGEEGSYGLNYAALGVVSSIILARNIETHEQRIARLEKEISDLQKELNALVNNE